MISDWKRLLARCAQWGRNRAEWERNKGHEIGPEQLPVSFAPATEDQIAREEARLGVRLPPSLRSFYLVSNGHGVVGHSIWAVRSVDQIGWMRDVVPELYEILFEDDPAVAGCLVVSGDSDAAWWLLNPEDVDGRGEWRAGRWASWYPGMAWIAADFFGLFENEVSRAERALEREQSPPPPLGTGRSRSALSVGDPSSPAVPGKRLARNGYSYVPAEGFTSVVTITAPAVARVGQRIPLDATRRSGPWNPVRQEEVRPEELNTWEPPVFERGVARSLWWTVDPPNNAEFSQEIPGTDPNLRWVTFTEPGVYTLRAFSSYPLPVHSNVITIRVE